MRKIYGCAKSDPNINQLVGFIFASVFALQTKTVSHIWGVKCSLGRSSD